jgi:hypothetical protein
MLYTETQDELPAQPLSTALKSPYIYEVVLAIDAWPDLKLGVHLLFLGQIMGRLMRV